MPADKKVIDKVIQSGKKDYCSNFKLVQLVQLVGTTSRYN